MRISSFFLFLRPCAFFKWQCFKFRCRCRLPYPTSACSSRTGTITVVYIVHINGLERLKNASLSVINSKMIILTLNSKMSCPFLYSESLYRNGHAKSSWTHYRIDRCPNRIQFKTIDGRVSGYCYN